MPVVELDLIAFEAGLEGMASAGGETMAQLMWIGLLLAIVWISEGALAQQVICRSAGAESAVLQMIDQAGELEQSLQKVLTETKSQSTAREASQKLAVLNDYIEHLMDPNRSISLLEIHEGLKRLPIFRQEVPRNSESVIKTKNPYLLQVVMMKRANKDFADLPHYIRAKFLEFLNEISAHYSITYLSPSWSLERVDVREITDDPSYSVRLNRGYRVFFTVTTGKDSVLGGKLITVYRISMKVTHE
jgi:hypothetical protein